MCKVLLISTMIYCDTVVITKDAETAFCGYNGLTQESSARIFKGVVRRE